MNHPTPTRMQIRLTPIESRELARISRQEKRDPRDQAAIFVRRGLGLDGKTINLSPLAVAMLTQVAKEEELDSIEEAFEFIVLQAATIQEVAQ